MKLNCDELVSSFAYKFNLRRYNKEASPDGADFSPTFSQAEHPRVAMTRVWAEAAGAAPAAAASAAVTHDDDGVPVLAILLDTGTLTGLYLDNNNVNASTIDDDGSLPRVAFQLPSVASVGRCRLTPG